MVNFSSKNINLGDSKNIVINKIIATGKSMISKTTYVSINLFVIKLKAEISNERCIAQSRGTIDKFEKIWGAIGRALNPSHPLTNDAR